MWWREPDLSASGSITCNEGEGSILDYCAVGDSSSPAGNRLLVLCESPYAVHTVPLPGVEDDTARPLLGPTLGDSPLLVFARVPLDGGRAAALLSSLPRSVLDHGAAAGKTLLSGGALGEDRHQPLLLASGHADTSLRLWLLTPGKGLRLLASVRTGSLVPAGSRGKDCSPTAICIGEEPSGHLETDAAATLALPWIFGNRAGDIMRFTLEWTLGAAPSLQFEGFVTDHNAGSAVVSLACTELFPGKTIVHAGTSLGEVITVDLATGAVVFSKKLTASAVTRFVIGPDRSFLVTSQGGSLFLGIMDEETGEPKYYQSLLA